MKIDTDKVKSGTDFVYKWIAIVGVISAIGFGIYSHFATRLAVEEDALDSISRDLEGVDRHINRGEKLRYHYQAKIDDGEDLTLGDKRRHRINNAVLDDLYEDRVELKQDRDAQEVLIEAIE
jgi:hypothetical protein